jgi:hypothetical protein
VFAPDSLPSWEPGQRIGKMLWPHTETDSALTLALALHQGKCLVASMVAKSSRPAQAIKGLRDAGAPWRALRSGKRSPPLCINDAPGLPKSSTCVSLRWGLGKAASLCFVQLSQNLEATDKRPFVADNVHLLFSKQEVKGYLTVQYQAYVTAIHQYDALFGAADISRLPF